MGYQKKFIDLAEVGWSR